MLRWITWPDARTTSILLAAAGFIQLARLARWVGERTWRKVA
ncbi:hypothetical protein [Bradyrhizobium sp. 41S5]